MREDVEMFNILQDIGAILMNGHFGYNGGNHGSTYINHLAIFQHPKAAEKCSRFLAERFRSDSINCILGPRNGGASLAERISEHLSYWCGGNVMPLAAEKTCVCCNGYGFYLTEDTIENIRGKRVLVVDDVGNSGRSVKCTIELVMASGGIVVGVGYLCNRGNLKRENFGDIERYESLLDWTLQSWNPAKGECQPCNNNVPLSTRFGHGGDSKQLFLPLSQKSNK
ncbi:MAG: phosphoribosyltransferase family protein [Patescibacteria group bacterium]